MSDFWTAVEFFIVSMLLFLMFVSVVYFYRIWKTNEAIITKNEIIIRKLDYIAEHLINSR